MKRPRARKDSVVVPLRSDESAPPRRNALHPVDELAHVNEQIAHVQAQMKAVLGPLKARKDELRAMIENGEAGWKGDAYEAVIGEGQRTSFNLAAIVEHYGPQALSPFLRITKFKRFTLRKRRR